MSKFYYFHKILHKGIKFLRYYLPLTIFNIYLRGIMKKNYRIFSSFLFFLNFSIFAQDNCDANKISEGFYHEFEQIKEKSDSNHSWPIYVKHLKKWYLKYNENKNFQHNQNAALYHIDGKIADNSCLSKSLVSFIQTLVNKENYTVQLIGPYSHFPRQYIRTVSVQRNLGDPLGLGNSCRPDFRSMDMMYSATLMFDEFLVYALKNNQDSNWMISKHLLYKWFKKTNKDLHHCAYRIDCKDDHIYENHLFASVVASFKEVLMLWNYKVSLIGSHSNDFLHLRNLQKMMIHRD